MHHNTVNAVNRYRTQCFSASEIASLLNLAPSVVLRVLTPDDPHRELRCEAQRMLRKMPAWFGGDQAAWESLVRHNFADVLG